jgi:hypothetical protein
MHMKSDVVSIRKERFVPKYLDCTVYGAADCVDLRIHA